jgi:hypothetical protein
MSSVGALGGSKAGGSGGSGGHKRGPPLGSRNKSKSPAATPSVPLKRGRPVSAEAALIFEGLMREQEDLGGPCSSGCHGLY